MTWTVTAVYLKLSPAVFILNRNILEEEHISFSDISLPSLALNIYMPYIEDNLASSN